MTAPVGVIGGSGFYSLFDHSDTHEIENLEILFFSTRLLRSNLLELPVFAQLRLASTS